MKKKAGRIIRKYYEYLFTKIEVIWRQRIFVTDDTKVKYILKKNKKSDFLAIIFSACTRRGVRARYNYMKSLRGIECNQLFVLDDYADDHRGAYYIGESQRYNEENAVNELVCKIIKLLGVHKIAFCGSSKGGYAALNFGLDYENSIIISGAPQYFLGDYLIKSGNIEAYRHILGENNNDIAHDILNQRLRSKILDEGRSASQIIHLHFSDKEHTYNEHIAFLLCDLQKKGYRVNTDVANYTNHSDISLYFPDYLRKVLNSAMI